MTGEWLTLIKVGFSSVQKQKMSVNYNVNLKRKQREYWHLILLFFVLLNSIITVYASSEYESSHSKCSVLRTSKWKQENKKNNNDNTNNQ